MGTPDLVPGAAWPLFLTAAAVIVRMPDGCAGIRVIIGHQIASDGDTARCVFMKGIEESKIDIQVIDFAVSEIPRAVIQMALQVGQFTPGRPQ